MTLPRVIQDSDDDADELDISPQRQRQLPVASITPEPVRGGDDVSSNELLLRELHSAQRHLVAPSLHHQSDNQFLVAPSLEWTSSNSPTISMVNRNQTSMGILESQREKRRNSDATGKLKSRETLKTYSSKRSQSGHPSSDSWFREESLDPLSEEQTRKKRKVDMGGFGETSEKTSSLGLLSHSNNPMLGLSTDTVDFAQTGSVLAVDLRATAFKNDEQRQEYEYVGRFDPSLSSILHEQLDGMRTSDEISAGDSDNLVQRLLAKRPEDTSTASINGADYNSQLDGIQKVMQNSAELNSTSPDRPRVRAKSMALDLPASSGTRTAASQTASKQKGTTNRSLTDLSQSVPSLSPLRKPGSGESDGYALFYAKPDQPNLSESLQLNVSIEKAAKRGRKRKADTQASLPDDTDELASDENTMGLPREQYIPLSSRSRSRRDSETLMEELRSSRSHILGEGEKLTQEHPSSQKGSAPNSDEIAIGLPKEQYKPRPSRSRGGVHVAVKLESLDFSRPKKKIKRGMTTGRILKKKAVDSDEEDDVVYVDEKPRKDSREGRTLARVKEEMEGVDLEGLTKPEEDAKPHSSGGVSKPDNTQTLLDEIDDMLAQTETLTPPEPQPKEPKKRGRKRKQTTESKAEVEVGPSEDHEALNEDIPEAREEAKEPKKRGRKRKKTTEETTAAEDPIQPSESTTVPDVPVSRDDVDQLPLKEKDTNKKNILYPPSTTSKQPKFHISSSQPEDEDPDPADAENLRHKPPPLPETPSRSASISRNNTLPSGNPMTEHVSTPVTNPKSEITCKGPTKHSPISTQKVPHRVGLSKRARIEPLLKMGSVKSSKGG